MWTRLVAASYNLLRKVEHRCKTVNGSLMKPASISIIEKLSPSAALRNNREWYLAKIADTRKFTHFDVALAFVILMDFALTSIDSITKWWYIGSIDLVLSAFLLILLICMGTMRPLLGRLMLVGIISGIGELFTDASGQYIAHSLIYPKSDLTIWTSPAYMPLSWLVTLTYLGYISWRLRALFGWRKAILLCGLLGAIDIPIFEEIAYYGGWWHYVPTHLMFGQLPVYVALFEGLLVAILPVLFYRLERRSWVETIILGIVIGIWIAFSALIAWLLLGH